MYKWIDKDNTILVGACGGNGAVQVLVVGHSAVAVFRALPNPNGRVAGRDAAPAKRTHPIASMIGAASFVDVFRRPISKAVI